VNDTVRLLGYSFLILFVELALIRYVPGHVRVFGFYLNFVLLAAFLGTGVGLLRADRDSRLRWLAIPALPVLIGLVYAFSRMVVQAPVDRNEFIWGVFHEIGPAVPRIGILPVVSVLFVAAALLFVPLGAALGAVFGRFRPLVAYSLNLVGSLLGVLTFAAASAARTSPLFWFGTVLLVWCALSVTDRRYVAVLVVTAAATLWIVRRTAGPPPEYWSPYYRINVFYYGPSFSIHVNGSFHQYALDLRPADGALNPYVAAVRRDYLQPYAAVPRVDSALVLGAGTGNDVALLLEMGAQHVDAVEIDPTIALLGRVTHFQRPYDDPRVRLHVTDARAYVKGTDRRYDVIVLGTLDSQTLLSGVTSLRLDNYVFTVEALEALRDRLKPGGRLVTYHMAPYPYIAAKIAQAITVAFGSPPRVWHEPRHRLFNYTMVAGSGIGGEADVAQADLLNAQVTLPRDNWPYLYLRQRTLPAHYARALGIVLAMAASLIALAGGRRLTTGFDGPMFFMGAGFLLLETKSVSEMALLFGANWTVNVLVFTAILTLALAGALLAAARPETRPGPVFAGLFVLLATAFAVPVRALLGLGDVAQFVTAGLVVGLPIFCSSWIFAILFRTQRDPARALAYNLLGAIVGGVLEYASLIVGFKALYVIAALMYGVALLTWRRRAPGAVPAAAA
jgi:SAM-dependent methyltransferase